MPCFGALSPTQRAGVRNPSGGIKLSDTKVYEPEIRGRLGTAARTNLPVVKPDVVDLDGQKELEAHLRYRGGKGCFINSQTRPLHASEEDETRRQGPPVMQRGENLLITRPA